MTAAPSVRPAARAPPLRLLLAALVALLWLPAAVIAAAAIWESYQRDVARAEDASLAAVRASSATADGVFQQLRPALEVLAGSPSLDQGDLVGFHAQASSFVRQSRLAQNVFLLAPDGRQLVNTLRPPGAELPGVDRGNRTFAAVAAGEPFVVSDLYAGPVSRRPMIAVGVPKVVGGEVAYVVGAGMEAAHFTQLLGLFQFPPGWTASFVDRSSVIVGRVPARDEFVGQRVTSELADAMATLGREGVFLGRTKEGTAVRAAFTTSPLSGFVTVVGIPEEDLLGPPRRLFVLVAILLVSVLALGLTLASWLGRRILGSMDALAAAALEIGRGHRVDDRPMAFQEADRVRLGMNLAAAELQQAQAELGQVTEELRARRVDEMAAMVDALHGPILVFDAELTIVAANTAAAQLFGYPRERLLGMDLFGITATDVRWKELLVDSGLTMTGVTAGGDHIPLHARCRVAAIGSERFIVAWLRAASP